MLRFSYYPHLTQHDVHHVDHTRGVYLEFSIWLNGLIQIRFRRVRTIVLLRIGLLVHWGQRFASVVERVERGNVRKSFPRFRLQINRSTNLLEIAHHLQDVVDDVD